METTILVHVGFPKIEKADVEEFQALAISSGAHIGEMLTAARHKPDAQYFIGTGKVEELKQAVILHEAQLVVIDHTLSPAQERNLERALSCRVLDRKGLILDIFAQRARTFEGKLQVELAQLAHLSTRLVRGWTHLERQGGGIGLRGPGETQLETDRRLIRFRIDTIKKRLEKVRGQRSQSRRARLRAAIPTVSLVGYTNAGKSTLFNRLTDSNVFAADLLFATLDPTLRSIKLPGMQAILVDTVGFIKDLPHDLVDAFRATLEESSLSDLLLHVIDVNDPERHEHIAAVNQVLEQIGANKIAQLEVFNKVDLIGGKPRIDYGDDKKPRRVWLSAQTGDGVDLLFQAILECLVVNPIHCCVKLLPEEGQRLAQLRALDVIKSFDVNEEGEMLVEMDIPAMKFFQVFN